jgi:putative RecB family exonuclease
VSARQAAIFRSGSLDESKPGDPLAYLSASRLKSFLTCRLRFFYEKVLGLKAPASPALQVGKAVHTGLQHYNLARWRGGDATPVAVQSAFDKAYDELEVQDPVDYEGKDRTECIDTGRRVLDAFLGSEHARDPRRVLGVEAYLQREGGDLPLPLVGVVDLVVEGHTPVDYKTAAATPNTEDESWQHEIQMTAYNLLLRDATGEEPGPGELVHLVKLKSPKIIKQVLPPVTQTQIERFKALADVYVDGVSREDYHPSPGMSCRWCSYRAQCAAWAGSKARKVVRLVA